MIGWKVNVGVYTTEGSNYFPDKLSQCNFLDIDANYTFFGVGGSISSFQLLGQTYEEMASKFEELCGQDFYSLYQYPLCGTIAIPSAWEAIQTQFFPSFQLGYPNTWEYVHGLPSNTAFSNICIYFKSLNRIFCSHSNTTGQSAILKVEGDNILLFDTPSTYGLLSSYLKYYPSKTGLMRFVTES